MIKKKRNHTQRVKSVTFADRFNYWFDNRVSDSSLGLIKHLIVATLVLALLLGLLIILLGFNGESEPHAVLWNSISTVINAWMPSFEDGSVGYIILMSVIAIAGLLFTSVLIGIFTSAIEEKINELKKGNSRVLEDGHIVILGFYPGEYTLIHQLVLAAAGKPDCIVVAGDLERDEMELEIKNNIDHPRNFRIICRTADICDPSSLEKCSIETSRSVIISPTDDTTTIKSILAVSALLRNRGNTDVKINAILSKNELRFPPSIAQAHHITALHTYAILAKIIAHSCTQNGLSEAFKEVFNFEGSELYLIDLPEAKGLTFTELSLRLDGAVAVGISRDNAVTLNPPGNWQLRESDRVLVFSEERDSATLSKESGKPPRLIGLTQKTASRNADVTAIIGSNKTLPIIIRELPEDVFHVVLMDSGIKDDVRRRIDGIAAERGLDIQYRDSTPNNVGDLEEIAMTAAHIVILNDHKKDEEKSDMDTVFTLLNLRDIRTRYGLHFNITAEMNMEQNQQLVVNNDHTDFVVTSSMSSLFLAQLAYSHELLDVFNEILSNEGNELYLKEASDLNCAGAYAIRDLRYSLLGIGYILLGYITADTYYFNPPLNGTVDLKKGDHLILLGEN